MTWFDIINSGVYVYKQAIAERDWRAATPALATTFQAASAVYTLGYGRQVNVSMSIKSQEDLYDWEALPPEARALFEAGFAKLGASGTFGGA